MSLFWCTGATIQARYGENYHAFSLFGPTHLFWLGLCVALCALLVRCYRRADEKKRRKILWVLSALMLADEAAKHIMTGLTGQWQWDYLPLQLCSVNIFVCLRHSVHPGKTTANLLYALSLPGAAVALLSPSWTMEPICNFMHLHSETIHIMLFLYPILLLAGGFRPDWHFLPRIFAFLGCLAVPDILLNRILGTNFLFLNGTDGAAINVFFASIFGEKLYMIGFVFLAAGFVLILYLPWEIAGRLKRRNSLG